MVSSISNFWPLLAPGDAKEDDDEEEDIIEPDAETKHNKDVRKVNLRINPICFKFFEQILEKCVKLINDEFRVNALLAAIDESYDPQSLNALCQICHCLLLSNRLAVHNCR